MTATKRKLILLVICVGAVGTSEVAFVASIRRAEEFGTAMASKDVIVDSRPRRVVVMERNTHGFDRILLDRISGRKGNGAYEYWAELHEGARLLACSKSLPGGDSYWFDQANMDTADANGVIVTLSRGSDREAYRLDWYYVDAPQRD